MLVLNFKTSTAIYRYAKTRCLVDVYRFVVGIEERKHLRKLNHSNADWYHNMSKTLHKICVIK